MMRFPILMMTFFLGACSDIDPKNDASSKIHFSLVDHIDSMSQNPVIAHKRVIWNEVEQQQSYDDYDLVKDLQIFKQHALPVAGVRDKYQIDSIVIDAEKWQLRYSNLKDDLALKELSVFYSGSTVDSVVIKSLLNSFIGKEEKKIVVQPSGGYQMWRTMHRFGKITSSLVQVQPL